ncbi:MAG: hypothetical protein FWG47_01645 [Propionibacteriaceae bacterium]|nr:hypothetical protein [Propionibacteriaceae bacterium]
MTRIAVLGGSGVAGKRIAEIVFQYSDAEVVLLGRNYEKLQAAREAILQKSDTAQLAPSNSQRLVAVQVGNNRLDSAIAGSDLVVVAAPVLNQLEYVADTVLKAGADWLDILIDTESKQRILSEIAVRYAKTDQAMIVGAGIHPGMPAVLARAVADKFQSLRSVQISLLLAANWSAYEFSVETGKEFGREIADFRTEGWKDGRWRRFSWSSYESIDFGSVFGKRLCVPMAMTEIHELPQAIPGLRDARVMIAGFHPVVDYVVMPLSYILQKIRPLTGLGLTLFEVGLKTFHRPPYGTVMVLEASGDGHDRIRMSITHSDAYELTSAAAAATVLQYLNGTLHKPGLQQAGIAIDPQLFLSDLKQIAGSAMTIESHE